MLCCAVTQLCRSHQHPPPPALLDSPIKKKYLRVLGVQKELIPQSLLPIPTKFFQCLGQPYTQPVGLGETQTSKELLLFIILIITLPVGMPARREQPLQKHRSRWSVPVCHCFPAGTSKFLHFSPCPICYVEVRSGQRGCRWPCLGSCPACSAPALVHGRSAGWGAAPRHGAPRCSPAVLALEIGLGKCRI